MLDDRIESAAVLSRVGVWGSAGSFFASFPRVCAISPCGARSDFPYDLPKLPKKWQVHHKIQFLEGGRLWSTLLLEGFHFCFVCFLVFLFSVLVVQLFWFCFVLLLLIVVVVVVILVVAVVLVCWLLLVVVVVVLLLFCYYVGVLLLLLSLLFFVVFLFVVLFLLLCFRRCCFCLFVCSRTTQQMNKKQQRPMFHFVVCPLGLPRERPTTKKNKRFVPFLLCFSSLLCFLYFCISSSFFITLSLVSVFLLFLSSFLICLPLIFHLFLVLRTWRSSKSKRDNEKTK